MLSLQMRCDVVVLGVGGMGAAALAYLAAKGTSAFDYDLVRPERFA
jgi:glycine/D-amino acid oxidase-like deaminating enzyme